MIGLLDTSILIAATAPQETAPDLSDFDEVVVSSLTWSELTMGLHATTSLTVYKQREARLETLKSLFGPGIAYDDDCAHCYGRLLGRVTARRGEARAHRIDRMIAATALAHGCVLVTRSIDDFVMFDGLIRVEKR